MFFSLFVILFEKCFENFCMIKVYCNDVVVWKERWEKVHRIISIFGENSFFRQVIWVYVIDKNTKALRVPNDRTFRISQFWQSNRDVISCNIFALFSLLFFQFYFMLKFLLSHQIILNYSSYIIVVIITHQLPTSFALSFIIFCHHQCNSLSHICSNDES